MRQHTHAHRIRIRIRIHNYDKEFTVSGISSIRTKNPKRKCKQTNKRQSRQHKINEYK